MSVYVDNLVTWSKISWCHMMADTDIELETMARAIGLRKEYKHRDHYDLQYKKRVQAIKLGAIEVTSLDLVRLRRNKKDI